jgi:RNA polymerase sigma factor (sigma-70 family)
MSLTSRGGWPKTGDGRRSRLDDFEGVYRDNVDAIKGYFARRCGNAQDVGDLTSETFVQAIGSFANFDASRGSPRGWLFGIARHVWFHFCASTADSRQAAASIAGQRVLQVDEIEELSERLDAERRGRDLLTQLQQLPEVERSALELVDLCGLTPSEAAESLGVSPGAVRTRLFRARAHLRERAVIDDHV